MRKVVGFGVGAGCEPVDDRAAGGDDAWSPCARRTTTVEPPLATFERLRDHAACEHAAGVVAERDASRSSIRGSAPGAAASATPTSALSLRRRARGGDLVVDPERPLAAAQHAAATSATGRGPGSSLRYSVLPLASGTAIADRHAAPARVPMLCSVDDGGDAVGVVQHRCAPRPSRSGLTCVIVRPFASSSFSGVLGEPLARLLRRLAGRAASRAARAGGRPAR